MTKSSVRRLDDINIVKTVRSAENINKVVKKTKSLFTITSLKRETNNTLYYGAFHTQLKAIVMNL